VSFSTRIRTMVSGYHPTFWVGNGMELFERLAYYGQATVFSIYLRDHLKFSEQETGNISSIFGSLIYLLPVFAGTIADKIGFRKAFSIAFFILAIGYFLIGSTGMAPFNGAYEGLSLFWVIVPFTILTAMGGSFIKPSVLGTVAVTTTPANVSQGYAIYYALVNAGAFFGPIIANAVRRTAGIEFVYLVSAFSCAAMLLVNLLFYKEVKIEGPHAGESIGTKLKNMVTVLKNGRFMVFLLIFSLYWIMFWSGFYVVLPFFITDHIAADANFEWVISAGALGIFLLQVPVNSLTKKLSTNRAILIGFIVSTVCFLIFAGSHWLWQLFPKSVSLWFLGGGIVIWSIGEMIQAPRYYQYIATLAPKGQQAMYQGYAFLPIAIAWMVGGWFGGQVYTAYAKNTPDPAFVWWIYFGIGVLAAGLVWLYNRFLAPREANA
jgi:POT family proton-dependent oligopeptide transporter